MSVMINGNTAIVLPLRKPAPAPVTIRDLVEQLSEHEQQHNPDHDTEIRALRMTPSGLVQVPTIGEMALTDWSKGQFAKMLGVSWDRYYAGTSGAERADEVNRRLARASGSIRLRTTKKMADGIAADGTLRAVVSREYATVPDSTIASVLGNALQGVEHDATIIRSHTTDLTTSFVVRIGKPYRPGGPGEVGEVWGGLYVRNSGVGYARLAVSMFLHRLACKNGMVVPLPEADLVRVRHRWITAAGIQASLTAGLVGIAEKVHRGVDVMAYSANYRIESVSTEVSVLLREAGLPLALHAEIMGAFGREPHESKFGIAQALTLAAQWQTPELRYDLEKAAGLYLQRR